MSVSEPPLSRPVVSIVLNDMDRSRETAFGFRSWLLQDCDFSFEIILSLFNEEAPSFEKMRAGANPDAQVLIHTYAPPLAFNVAAANNLGLHVASGEFVIFANSDVVYPPAFLRSVIGDMKSRGLSYICGARINLTASQTASLMPPEHYSRERGFESLVGLENAPGRIMMLALSPWIVARDVAIAVGGFDPAITCHEDSEFNDRAMHYLRRTGKQLCLYSLADIYGYHLHHPPSELYSASQLAKAILEPRRKRLSADPESLEDIVPTSLHDRDELLADLYATPSIVPIRRSIRRRLLGKTRDVMRSLVTPG